jgi:hypothetical protein
LHFVLGKEAAEHPACVFVNEVDKGEISARVADLERFRWRR